MAERIRRIKRKIKEVISSQDIINYQKNKENNYNSLYNQELKKEGNALSRDSSLTFGSMGFCSLHPVRRYLWQSRVFPVFSSFHSGFRDSDFDRVIGTFQNATNFITK